MRALVYGALAACIAFGAGASGGFFFGKGYCEGVQAEKERDELIERNRAELDRQIREAQRLNAARELEDQANAQPVTDDCGLPVERVRRLNLR